MKIAVVGAGVAGSTIALKISDRNPSSQVLLFEAGPSLVNGPPICHLHAGGSLYRQISDQDCLTLLQECVQVARDFKDTINYRPTVLTVPKHDPGSPEQIIRRMKVIKQRYEKLVIQDPANEVLGSPSNYFSVYDEKKIKELMNKDYPQTPRTGDDWMIPVVKNINLSKFKLPFVLVQEPGWSVMRYSAQMQIQLQKKQNCQMLLNTKVIRISKGNEKNWKLTYKKVGSEFYGEVEVDYLVNSCGYKTGTIDDMVGLKKNRMVQFKAAYLAKWEQCQGVWPEVIIHGIRKTPQGMGQFTPYQGKIFQIHGMTQNITLFPGGLAQTKGQSSHPRLQKIYDHILTEGWKQELIEQRTKAAINYIAEYIPSLKTAVVGGKPLYGGQQIPGNDDKLRTASVSFDLPNYARAQIVKASSAIVAAQKICEKLNFNNSNFSVQKELIHIFDSEERSRQVERRGIQIARMRKYPGKVAQFYNYPKL